MWLEWCLKARYLGKWPNSTFSIENRREKDFFFLPPCILEPQAINFYTRSCKLVSWALCELSCSCTLHSDSCTVLLYLQVFCGFLAENKLIVQTRIIHHWGEGNLQRLTVVQSLGGRQNYVGEGDGWWALRGSFFIKK